MAMVERFAIQPFHLHRKRLAPSQQIAARTKHHALLDGERLAATRPGVAVIHLTVDDETGEPSSIQVIGRYGEIPDEFEESIRAL